MGEIDIDHKLREIQREYLEFLDDEVGCLLSTITVS